MATLLEHERGETAQPLLEALLDARSGDGPAAVREAADRLLRRQAPWALEVAAGAAVLVAAAGDDRSVRLFRSWALGGGESLEDLARKEGVSGQRIGQIVQRAGSRVRTALAGAPAPWPWLVEAARRRLGTVTTRDRLEATMADLGACSPPSAELLAWLAGPYRPVRRRPEWLAVVDPALLEARTAACLSADGGVRRLRDVEGELAELGLGGEALARWISANGAVVVHDLVVSLSGQLAEAVERVLDAYGTERTAAQLAADLALGGRAVEEAALASAIRGARFSRTPKGAVRLSAWGEEPAHPGDEPAHPRKEPRRKAPPGSPRDERRAVSAETASPERLWLWVRVDADVLSGSQAPVPTALVEGLGLEPPGRRTFSSRWGPVTLAWEGAEPRRGSVRAVALATGARLDDTLLLGFSATGDLVVDLRHDPAQAGFSRAADGSLVICADGIELSGGAP